MPDPGITWGPWGELAKEGFLEQGKIEGGRVMEGRRLELRLVG